MSMLALVAESHLFGIKIWIVGRIGLTGLNRGQDYINATTRIDLPIALLFINTTPCALPLVSKLM
jgi:hypothetical protein